MGLGGGACINSYLIKRITGSKAKMSDSRQHIKDKRIAGITTKTTNVYVGVHAAGRGGNTKRKRENRVSSACHNERCHV